jgi:chloride channel 7
MLVVLTGLMVAFVGAFVAVFTEALTAWKFESCNELMNEGNHGGAFFAYICLSVFLVLCSGGLCYYQPAAAGSGIPEIKAFLNGVNLSNVVKMPVLAAKVLGMCFSCAAGLPLGKEGPMIHAGSIIGAAVSQGNTISVGFDNSWNKFQDLRNDHTKRDYVTIGAAAGVAAAFRAPIGGILFTLEEGASFWSTELTIKAFVCAVITQFTIGLIFPEEATSTASMFAFGLFENLHLQEGRANYFVYELPIFVAIGILGGILGALFNHINEVVSIYRKKHLNPFKWKRMIELVTITIIMAFLSFILSIMWQVCTPIPDDTSNLSKQNIDLLGSLVEFQCKAGEYNQLASIFFTSGDMAMRQLFHMREVDGIGENSFTTGPLILFFIPYFFMAAITSGVLAPAGLFVPTLLSGAALGRLIGHWLNCAFPEYVADSGTYALIGAAAILGGMARMTIAGCVIVLEACGNISYLLPLMVTFAASRYTGNAINESMYDMQIHLKEMPFLEGSLHSLGLLNFHPVSGIMAHPVVTIMEVDKVRRVMEILSTTHHNGFPVVSKDGRLRGLILRKTLCGLLKNKAYSLPSPKIPRTNDGGIVLQQAANISYDTLERQYPNFPDVNAIKMKNEKDLSYWLDVRAYMDTSTPMVNETTSIRRCYNLFRTMGLRHICIVDGEMSVVGIITRSDMNEHRLKHYWEEEGENLQKAINLDSLPPAIVYEKEESRSRSGTMQSTYSVDSTASDVDPEILNITVHEEVSDSPTISLRKKL